MCTDAICRLLLLFSGNSACADAGVTIADAGIERVLATVAVSKLSNGRVYQAAVTEGELASEDPVLACQGLETSSCHRCVGVKISD